MTIVELLRWGIDLIEILACITGFLYWKKIKHTYWKYFPFYLLAIVVAENTAIIIKKITGSNEYLMMVYQFFGIPVQFFFFFWLFYRYFKENDNKRESRWPLIGIIIYVGAWLVEKFFIKTDDTWFFSFSYTVGNVILSVFVLAFFIRFINSDKILGYKSDMMFWVCLGILIFYFGSLPYYGLLNTLRINGFKKFVDIYWFFQMGFMYIMYILFAMSFVWGKPKQ